VRQTPSFLIRQATAGVMVRRFEASDLREPPSVARWEKTRGRPFGNERAVVEVAGGTSV